MDYIWKLFGYDKVVRDDTSDTSDEEVEKVTEIMLPQKLLNRRNSKRFVIGDEGEEETLEDYQEAQQEWKLNFAKSLKLGTTLT